MSTPGTKLTPAERRKATLAAKAAKELEDNIAFQNKSRKAGGRQAKQVANQKADQPSTCKRTSSTAQVPAMPAQKARETQDDADEDEPEDDQDPAVVKSKAKARKYPARAIDIETDSGPEDPAAVPIKAFPRLDLANLPAKTKPTGGSKAKPIEATAGKTNPSKAAKLKPAAAKPVKIISESESKSESLVTASSDSEPNEHSSSEEGNDGPVDDADFLSEHKQLDLAHRAMEDGLQQRGLRGQSNVLVGSRQSDPRRGIPTGLRTSRSGNRGLALGCSWGDGDYFRLLSSKVSGGSKSWKLIPPHPPSSGGKQIPSWISARSLAVTEHKMRCIPSSGTPRRWQARLRAHS
ncbi:hypothetical protein DFH07DRAFT_774725 [Mycena maculata]|uniref:Uncharacterized protein n=1 Tax=Mycena maculata TaxID=230809 RepID=A0AAD7IVW8_9AGAR|nr:hypothetical protein DFH07DRAFT_774725 [Mycena maculata]